MDMDKDFTNSSGYVFNVRVLEPGDRYGRDEVLTWEGDIFGQRCVEFYAAQHKDPSFGSHGQFVSRYYENTLLGRHWDEGIDLQGDVPVWSIDGATFGEIMDWVTSI
jgi:hypothetical protein